MGRIATMTRDEYLAANSISRDMPWKAEGISERTWWRHRRAKREAETGGRSTPKAAEASGRSGSGRSTPKAANDNKITDLTATPEVRYQAGQDRGIKTFHSKTRNSKTYKETIMDITMTKDLILIEVRKQKNNKETKPPIAVLKSQCRLNELTVTKEWVRPKRWNRR